MEKNVFLIVFLQCVLYFQMPHEIVFTSKFKKQKFEILIGNNEEFMSRSDIHRVNAS